MGNTKICSWGGCYGRVKRNDLFARCSECGESAVWVLVCGWTLGLAVGLIGIPVFLYNAVINGSEATNMEIFWNVMWALLWIVLFAGILVGAGILGVHRLRAFLAEREIKDDWKKKKIEVKAHHAHQLFIEKAEKEAEAAKLMLTAGSANGVRETGQWIQHADDDALIAEPA